MTEIKCQACAPDDKSCRNCGGYGIVLMQSEAADGTKYWHRPVNHTVYAGKVWTSFDGVELVVGDDFEVRKLDRG